MVPSVQWMTVPEKDCTLLFLTAFHCAFVPRYVIWQRGFENASSLILVTLEGIVTPLSKLQFPIVIMPISVTLAGIVTLSSDVQSLNES